MSKPLKITPMLQQYMEIKQQHDDAILFYRMGDFYEMFFDDAVTASKVLGITLTSRSNKNDANKIPMCGVPYHAMSSYLAKLIKNGFRVAICEQTEDPSQVKSGAIVKREVVKVVTPGLTTEDQLLDGKSNRYLAGFFVMEGRGEKKTYGISFLDITTGEFLVAERQDLQAIIDEVTRLSPAELLIDETGSVASHEFAAAVKMVLPAICLTERPSHTFHVETARGALLEHFQTVNLAGFGCESMAAGITAAGALLQYLVETQKADLSHIEQLSPIALEDCLIIDDSSRRNLELTETIIGGRREGSLLATLDFTCTPMGARQLRKQLLFPRRNQQEIEARLDAVQFLIENSQVREELRESLARVYDLERLNSKVVLGSANARDLLALLQSLVQLPAIKALVRQAEAVMLREQCEALDELIEIRDLLAAAIREDAPVTLRDGKLIKQGYYAELDDLVDILRNGRQLILALEAEERQKTGISNLKVGFNKVFGYYLEVSRGQLDKVPDYFIRKQTLVNGERYITPDLKEFENKVAGAEEKRLDLEYRLFSDIRQQVAAASNRILSSAARVSWLDCLACLAEAASRYRYVRPRITTGDRIDITEGRHPVIERSLAAGQFVPNDLHLDQENSEVLIITGPNMAGKSTVLRQTALIVLMAQMGSYVPADQAEIGMVDRIFTRVGAMDDLRRGQSTFMVEMNETANILNNATENSLVILDEIGRGTSTFDGLAIAWAVVEELVNKNGKGVKTLFATHYHELVEMAAIHGRVKNFNIAVREWNDTIIFLHKLVNGGTSRSYGIQVASLAGVPARVVTRAHEILSNIEQGEFTVQGEPRIAAGRVPRHDGAKHPSQLALFGPPPDPVREKLAAVNPETLSPLEALTLLFELKKI